MLKHLKTALCNTQNQLAKMGKDDMIVLNKGRRILTTAKACKLMQQGPGWHRLFGLISIPGDNVMSWDLVDMMP